MTIATLRAQLDRGETTSRALCEAALARIEDAGGEGRATFTEVYADAALAAADAADGLRRNGYVASPLAGLPVSIKDLFDVAGRTTRAGSIVLAGAAPATADAPAVARLRAAGAVIVGKTNMTEFAYSGLGINPHYGTPRNPYDRAGGRIPGGSSSGAAISVTDAMAAVAIGTDTGGSVRIPAALCGLTGFKPTARRVPTAGAYPLSFTLDSIGPLGASVACCAAVDAILAGSEQPVAAPPAAARLRFLAPTNYVRDGVDAAVARAFDAALAAFRAAGVMVDEAPLDVLDSVPSLQRNAGFSGAEAYWWHREMLERDEARYDPQIARRIKRGGAVTTGDYIDLILGRRAFVAAFAVATEGYDALVWPAVPIVAPLIADVLRDDESYAGINALLLRNTSVVNVADGCAISLPMHEPGAAPAGLMLAGRSGEDARLLRIAATAEAALRPLTRLSA